MQILKALLISLNKKRTQTTLEVFVFATGKVPPPARLCVLLFIVGLIVGSFPTTGAPCEERPEFTTINPGPEKTLRIEEAPLVSSRGLPRQDGEFQGGVMGNFLSAPQKQYILLLQQLLKGCGAKVSESQLHTLLAHVTRCPPGSSRMAFLI